MNITAKEYVIELLSINLSVSLHKWVTPSGTESSFSFVPCSMRELNGSFVPDVFPLSSRINVKSEQIIKRMK
jgi:hypothetical protein